MDVLSLSMWHTHCVLRPVSPKPHVWVWVWVCVPVVAADVGLASLQMLRMGGFTAGCAAACWVFCSCRWCLASVCASRWRVMSLQQATLHDRTSLPAATVHAAGLVAGSAAILGSTHKLCAGVWEGQG
mgnify:CR=1 FL=1